MSDCDCTADAPVGAVRRSIVRELTACSECQHEIPPGDKQRRGCRLMRNAAGRPCITEYWRQLTSSAGMCPMGKWPGNQTSDPNIGAAGNT